MNRQVLAASLLSGGLGIFGGILLSFGEAERRARKQYAEAEEHLKTAYEKALEIQVKLVLQEANNGPFPTEDDLKGEPEIQEADGAAEDGSIAPDEDIPEYVNPYAKALEEARNPGPIHIDGAISDYGVSYIEEEEWDEDNGFFKGQVTLVYDGDSPAFFMDGVQIRDWEDRIGASIVADFYSMIPPGAPAVLYVRNHKRDEDYEVAREIP